MNSGTVEVIFRKSPNLSFLKEQNTTGTSKFLDQRSIHPMFYLFLPITVQHLSYLSQVIEIWILEYTVPYVQAISDRML